MRSILLVAMVGCDAGLVAPSAAPPPPPVVRDAGAKTLLGNEPGTLGPAFDGLALGQAIDQQAATAWLKQRGIEAFAYVRDGHLASINLRITSEMKQWPHSAGEDLDSYWFVPALHQHATEVVTEQGEFLQFDLEVPIDRWIGKTAGPIVPLDLGAKPLDQVENAVHLVTHSNYVDGRAHVRWTDSALAGAASATEIIVREVHTYDRDRDTVQSRDVHVELEASHEVYVAIDHRLVELFGRSHPKQRLEHTPAGAGIEHIELTIER